MANMHDLLKKHAHFSESDQKKAGAAIGGAMDPTHEAFMLQLVTMIDEGQIDPMAPDSLLHQKIYQTLTDVERGNVDLVKVNLLHEIRRIYEFYKSSSTPNSSPHLETMVAHVWQMKNRVELKDGDVFKI